MTNIEFMKFFRDKDSFNFHMREDERIEIFLGILTSPNDLNPKLLHSLCDNYEVPLQAVLNGWHLEGN
jgi:hypothetical protein